MSSNINFKTIIIAVFFSVILSTGIVLYVPQVQDALRGPQGEFGPQGEQGIQGVPGEEGSQRSWHLVHNFTAGTPWSPLIPAIPDLTIIPASEPYTSETFTIRGRELRLSWAAEPFDDYPSWMKIEVKRANSELWASGMSSGIATLSSDIWIVPGDYFIDVQTNNIGYYWIAIWDFY